MSTPRPFSASTWSGLGFALLLSACGGGGGGAVTGPSQPAGSTVTVTVFYDENGDGVAQPSEGGRVPGVTVEVGGRTGTTAPGTGRAVISGVPAGTWPVNLRNLPPFYQVGSLKPVSAPQAAGEEHGAPVLLPIGRNQPHTYLAFGDSITEGDGSSDDLGYRGRLQQKLGDGFGPSTVLVDAVPGSKSSEGADRLPGSLRVHPAYTLILYGTNDWNDKKTCRSTDPASCYTVGNLVQMVRDVRSQQSLPVVCTIIPVNEGYDLRVPPERNAWVKGINDLLKPAVLAEGAVVADAYAAFMAQPPLSGLFSDHIHPNDRGYELLAQAFYDAISKASASSAFAAEPLLFSAPPALPAPGHGLRRR